MTHAAGESSPGQLDRGTHAVVLAATAAQLADLARKLAMAGIPHVVIDEPDPPWNGQVTAIGICPVSDRAAIRRLTSSLPLLGRERKGALTIG